MNPIILVLVIGGGLALILLLVGIVISATSERSVVDERLGRYLDEDIPYDETDDTKESPVGDWLNTRLEGSNWGGGIARDLARADLKLKVGEYLALMLIFGLGIGLVLWWIGGRSILLAVVGIFIGTLIPRFYVKRQQSQRLSNFNYQLADMLNLMVNGLRAGYSTMQAMEAVSREMPAPISIEFGRVVQEMQIGLSAEDALDNLLRRIPSDDLDLVIAAMNVQREVGGNLAEILDIISHTIRERVRIKGEIRVLTSQVMYSGRFLALMPLMITGALFLLNRPYMMLFFDPETRIVGIPMLIVGALMIASGYFVMTKIASIDV